MSSLTSLGPIVLWSILVPASRTVVNSWCVFIIGRRSSLNTNFLNLLLTNIFFSYFLKNHLNHMQKKNSSKSDQIFFSDFFLHRWFTKKKSSYIFFVYFFFIVLESSETYFNLVASYIGAKLNFVELKKLFLHTFQNIAHLLGPITQFYHLWGTGVCKYLTRIISIDPFPCAFQNSVLFV